MTLAERNFLGRAGAVAILLALVVAAWLGPVNAYLGAIAAGRQEIAAKHALLQRYRALADAHAPQRETAPSGTALLYPDIPDAQAIALLQETVKSAAAAARIDVRGLQVLRVEGTSDAHRIAIRINASGDIASLSRLLHTIEAARPLLYPDSLQIQSRTVSSTAPPTELEFQLDISGFKAGAAS